MRRWLVTPLLVLALAACSDDDGNKDSGTTPDQGTVADQGPGSDAVSPDQATADQGGGGDSSTAQKVETYVPADNEISGWTEDSSKGGMKAGYTDTDIQALIDGKHDPYQQEGCDGFVEQFYIKDYGSSCEGKLTLYLWDMTTAAGAKNMFDKNKLEGETNAGLTFEDIPNVTDKGILAFDAIFIAYAYKNDYILQINAEATGASCGTTLKDDVKTWAQTVTGKLP